MIGIGPSSPLLEMLLYSDLHCVVMDNNVLFAGGDGELDTLCKEALKKVQQAF